MSTPFDIQHFGWYESPAETDWVMGMMPFPVFEDASAAIAGTGAGKTVLLWKLQEQALGRVVIRQQGTGDCVSMGAAEAADLLLCSQIVMGTSSGWIGETATEPIYAGSRVEIGKGGCGRQAGSNGSWAAKWATDYGIIPRQKYPTIDLSAYSSKLADSWGAPRVGVPAELETVAKQRPVKTTSQVTTYEGARDAIANGYPVTVASNQGFSMSRGSDGLCKPKGRWPHQMCFVGTVDDGSKPYLVSCNSWGPYLQGSPGGPLDLPPNMFGVDADTVNRMLQAGDSFAWSGLEGYPVQDFTFSMY